MEQVVHLSVNGRHKMILSSLNVMMVEMEIKGLQSGHELRKRGYEIKCERCRRLYDKPHKDRRRFFIKRLHGLVHVERDVDLASSKYSLGFSR